MSIGRTRLLAVRSLPEAVDLFAELGYSKPALPLDLGGAPLPGVNRAVVARSSRKRRSGYGLVIAETDDNPRSLRALAKSLRTYVHDKPLGVLGVTDAQGSWTKMIVLRPRGTSTGTGVTVTKLVVDVVHPSQHDAHVIGSLEWDDSDDTGSQRAIDKALDVEAVTNRFFEGLRRHYGRLVDAVVTAMDDDPAVSDRLKRLGKDPADRTALRILTQVLFVEFLQRKGFVEGRPDWLARAYRTKNGPYYQTVLEPLFYEGLGKPTDRRHPGAPGVPYLNGGLFDRLYGNVSLDLPDDIFDLHDGLLGYLDRWTFTVSEEMPDETEVAVDPEMLGKVFEHLAGEASVEEHGTVYTPRPVVHFMCREALVPWLQDKTSLTQDEARTLLTHTDPLGKEALGATLGTDRLVELATALPQRLDDLRVLDPAVGSGAFLLGMVAEVIRLRSLCFATLNQGAEPGPRQVTAWKEQAIRDVLYGVDIEPRAIELCRLRLWLSLMVDLPESETPRPLPNLEFRTFVANSLTDYVGGVPVQETKSGRLDYFHAPELAELHERWFHAVGNDRETLLTEISAEETRVVTELLAEAKTAAASDAARAQIDDVVARFSSPEREFPCFMPALHAPEIAQRGGWDIIIMNPPYVGRKEIKQRLTAQQVADLELHYGDTNDLMILFAHRALQLVRPRGIVSMIFNDSITTSVDGQELRREWWQRTEMFALARTRCFVGRAITGGVVVLGLLGSDNERQAGVRWVEGHGRPVDDFAEASSPIPFHAAEGKQASAGALEVWSPPSSVYGRLPQRPLFRPSPEALTLLSRFEACREWSSAWSRWNEVPKSNWKTFTSTGTLRKVIAERQRTGVLDGLEPGKDWVLLGLVIEGGQGLATADDRQFVAAVEGTEEAAVHLRRQEAFEALTLEHPNASLKYRQVRSDHGREQALLTVWQEYGPALEWSRIGSFRIAPAGQLLSHKPTEQEKRHGISTRHHFVPYEKGDDSDQVSGQNIGAKWSRHNPLVIDWSTEAVALLRKRASTRASKRPRFQSEQFWFRGGVAWNRTASYLRVRRVPDNAIFSSEAPTIVPQVEWLTADALMALLNSRVLDFVVRTFLSSRMHLDVGDIRRLPVPVLTPEQTERLTALGREAVQHKDDGGAQALEATERQIDSFVLGLYGLDEDADLWVPR